MSITFKSTELNFLRWFYQHADFGPADSDVRDLMKEKFVAAKGQQLPKGYERDSDAP